MNITCFMITCEPLLEIEYGESQGHSKPCLRDTQIICSQDRVRTVKTKGSVHKTAKNPVADRK